MNLGQSQLGFANRSKAPVESGWTSVTAVTWHVPYATRMLISWCPLFWFG